MTKDKARTFAALHVPGDPLILFNIWDGGSAKEVAEAGARAIATGSWSVAASFGLLDAEAVPITDVLANLRRIVSAVDLPVSLDFEGGYAAEPMILAANFARAIEGGAIGCNFEDQRIGGEGLFPVAEQTLRIASLKAAAPHAFVNARTDLFLKSPASSHGGIVDEALERGRVYAQAGADGLFVPGLIDEGLIARICESTPLPVNVMRTPGGPDVGRLGELGVARISFGPRPYRIAMHAFAEAARKVYGRAV